MTESYSLNPPRFGVDWNHPRIQALVPWMFPASVIILWQLLSIIGLIPARVLPAPSSVIGAAFRLVNKKEWNDTNKF